MRFRELCDKDKTTVRNMLKELGFPTDEADDNVNGFFCTRGDMNQFREPEAPKPETLKEKLKRISKPELIDYERE